MEGCGKTASTSEPVIDVTYSLERQYTGETTNTLTIGAEAGSEEKFALFLSSVGVETSIEQSKLIPLSSQVVTLTYAEQGIYSADFEIKRSNGQPYVHEILTWEYSEEVPDPPIISFAEPATNTVTNNLLVSDSRSANTTEIWIGGDISTAGQVNIEDGGYWQEIASDAVTVPITLTSEDGLKVVEAKFKNIYGNESEEAIPAEIILQTTAATDCDAVPLSSTISNNKLTLKLTAISEHQTYYSVMGDIKSVVDENPFTSGDTVYVYLEPSPGQKTITVYLEDVAGNICLAKELAILIDPDFESEGIWVEDATYWTTTENIVVDIFFDHFEDQEPLQLKITGDVVGSNTNAWIDYEQDLPITLSPASGGSMQILAQYKDTNGDESYLVSKRIYLKPTVELQGAGAELDVVVSNILDAESITIIGCAEPYNEVAYETAYTCNHNAATVDVTYNFPDDITLTLSEDPTP